MSERHAFILLAYVAAVATVTLAAFVFGWHV